MNDVVFSLYLTEILTKLVALGPSEYLSKNKKRLWNRIDLIAVSGAIAWRVYKAFDQSKRSILNIGRVFMFSRVLCLLRYLGMLYTKRKRFDSRSQETQDASRVLIALFRVIPAVSRYVMVLFALFYCFALVGMEMFAGKLDPRVEPKLNATSFGYYGYSYNFDNFPNALTALFGQMVVNNWPVLMEGCSAVANVALTRTYFIAFYFFSVVVVLNVLLAFLIESYQVHFNQIGDFEETSSLYKFRLRFEQALSALSLEDGSYKLGSLNVPHNLALQQMFRQDIFSAYSLRYTQHKRTKQ